jgi:para-aminobenzoate synthetase/4-amino-4-deoxychorismate lyase
VGFFSPDRKAQFNVAIRTVLIDNLKKTAEYGVGGGIVWDSEKVDELDECHTKARILTRPTPAFALLETLLWTPEEGYFLLESHLERLAASAAYFARPVEITALREQLSLLADTLPARPHRIRLTLPPEQRPNVEAHPLRPMPSPYRIRLAQQPVNTRDPFLYHKTTHRRVYEKARSEAPGYDDVVLWNEKKEVTESCIANIVVEREGRLLTPPVCAGLLPGTYRSLLLKEELIIEKSLSIEELRRCSRIYLINSVRGMWEIRLDWPEEGR